jgi:hypothetical protein
MTDHTMPNEVTLPTRVFLHRRIESDGNGRATSEGLKRKRRRKKKEKEKKQKKEKKPSNFKAEEIVTSPIHAFVVQLRKIGNILCHIEVSTHERSESLAY